MEPSPRANPEGTLMGSWRVVLRIKSALPRGQLLRVVKYFPVDGRDKAEEYLSRQKMRFNERYKLEQTQP
jgi:hypothetical protein